MSFLDSIRDAIGSFGGALASKVGLVKDVAMVSNHGGLGLAKGIGEVAHYSGGALSTMNEQFDRFYKLNIAKPIVQAESAVQTAAQKAILDDDWTALFRGTTWDEARGRAVKGVYATDPNKSISIGQGASELAMRLPGATNENGLENLAMSDQQFRNRYYDTTSFNLASGALDFEAQWYLNPGNLLAKPVGLVGRITRVRPIAAGTDVKAAIGSTDKIGQRWDTVKEGIRGKSSFQIWTAVDGLRDSRNGPALASALYKADKVTNPVERDSQLNMIGRIIYGDESAKLELSAQHAEIADQIAESERIRNHLVDSVSQPSQPSRLAIAGPQGGDVYFHEAKAISYFEDPAVEGEFAQRLGNLADGELILGAEAERLQNVLDLHGAATGNQLRVGRFGNARAARATGAGGTKAMIRDLSTEKPAWVQGVVTKSLWNVPVQVLKIPARVADSLITMRGHGQVNLHDTGRAVDELQALFDRPYFRDLDPARKDKLMSVFVNASGEEAQLRAINDIEATAFAHMAAKHGLDPKVGAKVFNEYVQKKQTLRGRASLYGLKTRQSYSEAPHPTEPGLAADTYMTEDGVVVRAPLLASHLANNVPILDADLVNHVFKREASTTKAVANWLQDNHYSMQALAMSQGLRKVDGFAQGLGEVGVDMLNGFSRIWKWTQLTRLGYTLRNFTDSEARAHSQMGSAMVMMNIEGMWHSVLNRGDDLLDGRYRIAMAAHAIDQRNAHEIEDLLVNPNLPEQELESLRTALLPIQRRLDAAEKTRVWEVYKPPRRSVGMQKIETPWGEIDAPFTDNPDDLNKILSSATGMTERLIADGEARNLSRMTSTGDWVRIEPHEPHFRAAWLDSINKTIKQDPMGQRILEGWSDDQLVYWLSRDDEGQRYARRLPYHAVNKEEWVTQARSHVETYVPAELRETAANRNLRGSDLDQWINAGGTPSAVNGPALQYALGKGPAANALNRMMHFTAKWLGDKPETKLARHPFFVAVYRQRAREEAERIMFDPHRVASGKSAYYLDAEDMERIRKTASAEGVRQIRRIMYDAAGHSNAATRMRFLSPFMGAWEDTLRRWWTISKDKPEVLNYFRMGFQAPKKAGLITDENGNVLAEGEHAEQEFLQIRLPDWAGGTPLKIGGMVAQIPTSSFNVWLQSDPWWLPGFGPLVQMPVSDIVKHKPELEPLVKSILPYGTYNDAADALLPATGRRARSLYKGLDDRTFAGDYAKLYQDALYEWDRGGRKGPMPTEEQAIKKAQGLYYVKVANNVGNAFPATFKSPWQFMRDGYNVLLEQAAAEGHTDEWALDQFVQKYGHEALYLIGSLSQNNADISATAEGVQAYKKYAKFISGKETSQFSRQIVGKEDEGAYSSAAYDYQMSQHYILGSTKTMREYKDPAESIRKTNVNMGWFDYNQYLTNLDAVAIDGGLKSWRDSPVLSQMRREFVDEMVKDNPDWVSEFGHHSDPTNFDVTLGNLTKLDFKSMQKVNPMRTDFTAMQDYLDQRQQYADVIAERESAGIRGMQNNDVKAMWTEYVTQLAHDNSLFADNWFNGTLEFDPMLLDTTEEGK